MEAQPLITRLCGTAMAMLVLVSEVVTQPPLYVGDNLTYAERNRFCDTTRPYYCENHIACISRKSMACVTATPMDSEVVNVISNTHNRCRKRVTRPTPDGAPTRFVATPRLGRMPPSTAFMMLNWDVELAALASLWAVSCATVEEAENNEDYMYYAYPKEHSEKDYITTVFTGPDEPVERFPFCFDVSRFPVGGWLWIQRNEQHEHPVYTWRQLLWTLCANVTRNIPHHIIESYRPPIYSLGADYPEPGVCMLWATSSRFGCGHRLAKKEDSSIIQYDTFACLYGPAPLVPGERVYEAGNPGTGCPPQAPVAGRVWPQLCVARNDFKPIILVTIVLGLVIAGLGIRVANYF